jgi:adenosylcobinamide kinase/adenosylcobinamide-phosphate guanylyltransferase
MALILVGGGARSGKSRWALSRARQRGGRLVYIATAEALDEEMAARIVKHRAERDSAFQTIEEPLDLAGAIRSAECDAMVVE